MPENFDKDKLVSFWIDSSDKDYKTMETYF